MTASVHALGNGGERAQDALAQLIEELDNGAVGVISVVVTADGTLKLTICGRVSVGDLALAGICVAQKALETNDDG